MTAKVSTNTSERRQAFSHSLGQDVMAWATRTIGQIRFGVPADTDAAERAVEIGSRAEVAGYKWTAIAFYRRALEIDRSCTPAIAGLGRVQFERPGQPFMDELRRRFAADVCEVIIEVRNPCNYRCFYCVAAGHNNEPVKRFDLDAVDRTLSQIRADLVVMQFDCGGGEPTVHPQFGDLLRVCAGHGAVSFPSNNSQDPARWLPADRAKRIYVRAAVHPETETKTGLDRYAKHARYLMSAGCEFSSMFISHPTRLSRIAEYKRYFGEQGVPFMPVPFIGEYEGCAYPHSFTEEEKKLIGLVDGEAGWYQQIQPHVNRIRNFRGIPCLAGFRSLTIARDGGIRRCVYDARKLDQPLSEPTPCQVKNCGCGLVLRDLNPMEAPDFYNFFAPRVGLDPVDLGWMDGTAKEHGYKSFTEAMVVESTRMYDELMRAYGKEDFPE